MSTLPAAHSITHHADATDHDALTYDARLLRRKRLVTEAGTAFLVDLPQTTSVNAGDCPRAGSLGRIADHA